MNDLLTAAPHGYSLIRTIGRGASSVVWETQRSASGARVALKILEADVSDADAVRRFEREREAMTALARHRNILTIVDAGVQGGRPWLAMELCRRGSLATHIAHGGPLDLPAALRVLDRLADALAVAHEAGVVHCDIKPANIMLTDAGEPALGDFGIARVSVGRATTTTVGGFSLDHVAPELLDGGRRSPQSDVYSLGTTAWELLAGHPPFRQTEDVSVGAVLTRILRQPLPESARVPPELLALLRRMAAKTAEERPASMREVGAEVRALAVQLGVALGGPPLPALTAVERELADQPLTAVDPELGAAATHVRASAQRASSGRRTPAARGRVRQPVMAAAAVLLVAALGAAVVIAQTFGEGDPAPATVAVQESAPAVAATPASPTVEPPVAELPSTEALGAPAAAPRARQAARAAVPVAAPPAQPAPPPTPTTLSASATPPKPTPKPSPSPSPSPTPCVSQAVRGDIDGDGKVGSGDQEILHSQWKQTGSDLSGDLNGDGTVDITDMSILLGNWNKGGGGGC